MQTQFLHEIVINILYAFCSIVLLQFCRFFLFGWFSLLSKNPSRHEGLYADQREMFRQQKLDFNIAYGLD